MTKYILSFIAFLALISFVQANPVCNQNNSAGSPGVPLTSCYYTFSNFSIGLGAKTFFIDTGYDVTYKGGKYRLRFGVPSTSAFFNEFQAIIQTAYATKSEVSVIFPNYDVTTVGDAIYGISETECRTNVDNNKNSANMYCPIQSISLNE